jgi:hypothetical protein
MAHKLILFILVAAIQFSVNAQISFYKVYGDNGVDNGQGVVQLPDSSYAITGSTSSLFDGASNALLMVVDSAGSLKWSRSYGGDNSDWGRRIFHKPGVGFWIAGYSNSFSALADFDFYLFHTDESGNLLWEYTYGTSDWEKLNDAIMLPDNSFLLVGETVGLLSQEEDGYMVRVAADGSELWSQRIGYAGIDRLSAALQLNGSTLAVAGRIQESTDGEFAALLRTYDLDGNLIFEDTYGSQGQAEIFTLTTYDNMVYAAGYTIRTNETDKKMWLLKLWPNLTVQNEAVENTQGDLCITSLAIRDFDNLYFTGWTTSAAMNPFEGGADVFFYRYHTNLYWNGISASFSGVGPDEANQLIISHDGSPVLVGKMSDATFSSGGSNITLIKLKPNNELPGAPEPTGILAVTETDEANDWLIYPNPTMDLLYFNQDDDNYSVIIRDVHGRIQIETRLNGSISLANLAQGVYWVEIFRGDQRKVFRVIRQ